MRSDASCVRLQIQKKIVKKLSLNVCVYVCVRSSPMLIIYTRRAHNKKMNSSKEFMLQPVHKYTMHRFNVFCHLTVYNKNEEIEGDREIINKS